ncbi:MAG: hypothetical protein EOO24_34895 [Comamonadaceae bacterium]|nr:MAG: hypothetical protein EOO24_34895 [Comamonadaceae bacterium]
MRSSFLTSALAALALGAAFAAPTATAQPYPNKPVRVVIAFSAGGTTDILARSVAQKLGEQLKQPFTIDNKPGAGGREGDDDAHRLVGVGLRRRGWGGECGAQRQGREGRSQQ